MSAEGCAGAAVREGMVPAFLAARCLCGGMPVSDLPSIVGWWFASTFFFSFCCVEKYAKCLAKLQPCS